MKKALLWGSALCAALCAMLVFMGCSTDEDPNKETTPDGPKTPAGWAKGIENFSVTATDNPGEFKYSFSPAEVESGTITYTLLYAEGKKISAAEIKAAQPGKEDNVEPGDNIIYCTPGKTYSIVVEASADGVNLAAYSAVKIVTAKAAPPPPSGGKSLTVTGIPSSVSIDYVILIEDMEFFFGEDEVPVAIGMNNGSGAFTLLPIDETTGQPNYNEAWKGTGEYYILLGGDTENYVYTDGADFSFDYDPDTEEIIIQGLEKYNFTSTTTTIDLSKFKSWGPSESSGDLAKITITGIPPMMSDATTPNPDGVTFMLVIPTDGQNPLAYGFAVVGGTLPPGGDGVEVAEIKQDGTAEVDLYDSAEAIAFLMGIMSGTPGNLPTTKSIGGSGTVSVLYAKVSEGENISMPQNTRVWMNVTFEDPLELNWSQGFDVPAQQP